MVSGACLSPACYCFYNSPRIFHNRWGLNIIGFWHTLDVAMTDYLDSIEIFKALSDETRFKIFLALARSRERLCVNAIVKKLGISQPAVSQHLKILKIAKIADSAREGHKIHYGINRDFINKSVKKINLLLQNAENQVKDGTQAET